MIDFVFCQFHAWIDFKICSIIELMICAKFLPGSGSASGKPPPPPVIAASLGFKSTKVQQAWGSKVHSVKTLLPQERLIIPSIKELLDNRKEKFKRRRRQELCFALSCSDALVVIQIGCCG